MNNVIFTFSKPSPLATVATGRLAGFVAETLKLPLIWDEQIADVKADVLIMIAGSFAFCGQLENLARAIRRAKRIVWIQNDYTIIPPKAISNAESPFRKAFRIRHEKGKAPLDYWTTLHANMHATPRSRYINWNTMAYSGQPKSVAHGDYDDLFYYGAFRVNRKPSFDRYFKQHKVPVTISNATDKFRVAYPRATHIGSVDRTGFTKELRRHGLGLYIEDKKSHVEFHSPSTRFYEMLSAGLPMVFEPECVPMLKLAGYDIRSCLVKNGRDLREAMERRTDIATYQYDEWHRPYRAELRARLKKIYRLYTLHTR